MCGCPRARAEREKSKATEAAEEHVRTLFGDFGEDTVAFLVWAVREISGESMVKLSADLGGGTAARLSVNSKGKIRVVRDDARRVLLEG
jgi:hypothetical protein